MATSDVTFQDGLKHPYLLALVRWCVSSFWTTATVILHRLITARIPQVKAPKQSKVRPASYEHLHPEPRVHCEVLHAPDNHTVDVIFVHGLYGSLKNTWRQGEWHTKYDQQPNKVALRRPHSIPTCKCADEQTECCTDSKNNVFNEESDVVVAKTDETGQNNENNNTNAKTRSISDDKNDELDDRNDISYEISDKYTDSNTNNAIKYNRIDKNDGNLLKNVKNYENNAHGRTECSNIERIGKIRKNNLKDESGCGVANNDKISENNLSNEGFIDGKNALYDKIKDWEIRPPSSNIQEYISDINIRKDYTTTNEEINDAKTILYDTIRDINIQKDFNNCSDSEQDLINREVNSNLYDNIKKILPKENLLITEKFYNNTLLDDVDIGSYETQAQFVKDLFQNSVKVKSESGSESESKSESESEVKAGDCKCEEKCEPGCGCICDDCYSPCWPRDWIRVDYPGARVISINYTSDPYLWRPLWVKESKRLRLHERAEQMMSQLLELGVGERPIIWVGHSKGGLFIKKMYCEAYEAHLKLAKDIPTQEDASEQANEQNTTESRNDNEINHCRDKETDSVNVNVYIDENSNESSEINDQINEINESVNTDIDDYRDEIKVNVHNDVNLNEMNDGIYEVKDSIHTGEKQYLDTTNQMMISTDISLKESNDINDRINEVNESVNKHTEKANVNAFTEVYLNELNDRINETVYRNDVNLNEFNDIVSKDVDNKEVIVDSNSFDDVLMNNRTEVGNKFVLVENEDETIEECDKNGNIPNLINAEEKEENASLLNLNEAQLLKRARLWRNSAGFMFYSVPHRGSPLADIKTPITARSIELMEICKDCPLVLSLQQSWRAAAAAAAPPVRSLVETCRTLMSVLYLRIVSVDSADPGIGSLHGVDVDHREICKPSSRSCLLYRELMTLMHTALTRH